MNETKRETPTPTAVPVPAIQVRIDRLLEGSGKTKAFASASIAGAYAIHGLRVIESDKGCFVAMPQESYLQDGVRKYHDIFHAVTAEARTALNNAVETAYRQALVQRMAQIQQSMQADDQAAAAPEQTDSGAPAQGDPSAEMDAPDPDPQVGMAMGM